MTSLHKSLSLVVLGTALSVDTAVYPATSSTAPIYGQTAKVESASGRITSVQGNTFTLEVSTQSGPANGRSKGNEKALTFTLDQDTDVYGKIAVGAEANVTYREQDGNNIAVSVHIVQQPS
jgi:hypothetical protein